MTMLSDEIAAALRDLADARIPVATLRLSALSGPTRAECEAVGQCLAGLSADRRRALLAAMVARAEDDFHADFVDIFRACLDDAEAAVRCSAIEGLWEDARPDLIAPLMRLLEADPEPSVRAAAATALGRYVWLGECEELDERRARPIREALTRLVSDPSCDIDVRRRALEAVAYVNDDEVRRLIDGAYHQGDQRLRESALFAMGRSADRIWSETVLGDLADDAPAIRLEAARAAGELRLTRAAPRLVEMGVDPDREVQGAAIWALGQVGGKRAQEALRLWATGDDEERAAAANDALAEMEFADRNLDLLVYDPQGADLVETDLEDDEEDGAPAGELPADEASADQASDEDEDVAPPHGPRVNRDRDVLRRGLLGLDDEDDDEDDLDDDDLDMYLDEDEDDAQDDDEDDAAARSQRRILGLR